MWSNLNPLDRIMTQQDFKRAFAIADSKDDLSGENLDHLEGCGLPGFQPVAATIRQVASLIRWQAKCLDGSWDGAELTELQNIFRRRVNMLG
jgi:hypothetical protein